MPCLLPLSLREYDDQSWNGGNLDREQRCSAGDFRYDFIVPSRIQRRTVLHVEGFLYGLLAGPTGPDVRHRVNLGGRSGPIHGLLLRRECGVQRWLAERIDLIFEVYTCLMVSGCTDSHACNYDETATIENGTCHYGTTYYEDADGDGFGNPLVTVVDCAPPTGYVENGEDDYPLNGALSQTGTALSVDVGTVLDLSNETEPYVVNGDLVNAGEILLPPVKNSFILDIKGDFINHGSISGIKILVFFGRSDPRNQGRFAGH